MDEVRNDRRIPDAKTHCDLYLGGRGRRASKTPPDRLTLLACLAFLLLVSACREVCVCCYGESLQPILVSAPRGNQSMMFVSVVDRKLCDCHPMPLLDAANFQPNRTQSPGKRPSWLQGVTGSDNTGGTEKRTSGDARIDKNPKMSKPFWFSKPETVCGRPDNNTVDAILHAIAYADVCIAGLHNLMHRVLIHAHHSDTCTCACMLTHTSVLFWITFRCLLYMSTNTYAHMYGCTNVATCTSVNTFISMRYKTISSPRWANCSCLQSQKGVKKGSKHIFAHRHLHTTYMSISQCLVAVVMFMHMSIHIHTHVRTCVCTHICIHICAHILKPGTVLKSGVLV